MSKLFMTVVLFQALATLVFAGGNPDAQTCLYEIVRSRGAGHIYR